MASNINSEYEAQIASIVDSVMETVGENPKQAQNDLTDIINETIDERSIYYADQAYYLARYHLEHCGETSGTINWSDVWEMVFNDVYTEVGEKIKENNK